MSPLVLAAGDNTLARGGSAGFLALLIVVLLFLATVLLIRNMSGRLKRLPKEFPPPPGRGRSSASGAEEGPAGPV